MTELQEKELELLKYFIDVCNCLQVKYYLVCGSALGAVKYGGFIPWDDDIDVALFRKDYEVFVKNAKQYLPSNIFVQTYKTDPYFPQIYCKLRDSNTTYIENSAKKLTINHGIFIDVFPLDGYPEKWLERKKLEVKKRIYQNMLWSCFELERKGISEILYKIYCILGINRNSYKIVEKYEKLITLYSIENSKYICNHGNWQGKKEYAECDQYGRGIIWNFESLSARIPENYDKYLIQKYGDWKQDLPLEKQIGHHSHYILDIKKSYRNYIENGGEC